LTRSTEHPATGWSPVSDGDRLRLRGLDPEAPPLHPQAPSNGNFLFELDTAPAAPVQPGRARGRPRPDQPAAYSNLPAEAGRLKPAASIKKLVWLLGLGEASLGFSAESWLKPSFGRSGQAGAEARRIGCGNRKLEAHPAGWHSGGLAPRASRQLCQHHRAARNRRR